MAFVTVTVYYRKCPDCGQKWSAQLSQEKVIRVGKETFVCKCKKEWATGYTEWAHLSSKQRRDYFISTAEIGVLLICTLIPALFGYAVGERGWRSAAVAAGWGLAVGFLFVLLLWTIKVAIVGLSLRRCPSKKIGS